MYDNFLERIKIKLLINTDLSKGKLGKIIYGSIKKGIDDQIELSKINNTIEDISSEVEIPSEYYFQRRRSVYLNSNPRNNLFLETTKNNNNVNENNKLLNKSIINNQTFNITNINNINNKKFYIHNNSKTLLTSYKNLSNENIKLVEEIEKDNVTLSSIKIKDPELNEEFTQL